MWHLLTTNLQRMSEIGLELLYALTALYKQVSVGSIDPYWLWCITGSKLHEVFLSNLFVTYLEFVLTKTNKSQKISTCCGVKHALFILEKIKKSKKGQLTPLRLLGLISNISHPIIFVVEWIIVSVNLCLYCRK